MPILKTVLDANALDEDRVYKQFYNVSGAGVSPNSPVQLDIAVNTDGVAVTQCKSAATGALFLGIVAKDTDDSEYGLACIYGPHNVALSLSSAGLTGGAFLVAQGTYFDDSTLSAAQASAWDKVVLIETYAASAGYTSAAQIYNKLAFIRAM